MQLKKAISSLLVMGSVVALVLFGLSENTANAENTTLQTPTETVQSTNVNGNLNLIAQPSKGMSPMPGGAISVSTLPSIIASGNNGNSGSTNTGPLSRVTETQNFVRPTTLTAQ